ncbi:hypothetical protein BDR26DRAFT_893667 [Obelidium mucronatum]|nr:hypothetical protein BDR26DRAFT_893667 [Obelidium mucronatum]
MEPGYPRYNLFSASSIASQKSNPGHRSGPGFKTGMSSRGPPSVAESIAKEDCLSKDTKQLFKSMMGSSKLSNFQQRMLDQLVSSGSSLPSKPHPGMAPRPSSAGSMASASTTTSGFSQADINAQYRHQKKRAMMAEITCPRPSLRPLATILESDAFEQEKFRPTMKKDRNVEKKKLQRFMETDGGKNEVVDEDDDDEGQLEDHKDLLDTESSGEKKSSLGCSESTTRIGYGRRKGCNKGGVRGTVARAAEGAGANEIDEFDMVFKEIEERKQWLDDMVALGRGDVYRKQIQSEIALRIKRLEQIDRDAQ